MWADDNNEASERALAALRAKGQLLELETEARQRMSSQLAEVTSAHAAQAEAAKADLQKERSARVALAAALKAAEEEATALRGSSRESSSSLARLAKELDAVQTNQFALEAQNQALIKQLSELRLGEMRSQKGDAPPPSPPPPLPPPPSPPHLFHRHLQRCARCANS